MDTSVIVPTRNRSALLAMTLRSVLRQEDVDFEVIVVDEASTDGTAAFLSTVDDARVRVIRHDQPRGLSAARNHGAAEARGEWLAFVDDDDLWAPDKLVRQLEAAQKANSDWVYTGSVNIDGRRITHGAAPLPPEEAVAALQRYNAIPGGGSNVVLRQSAWRRIGPFDVRFQGGEDWDMWIRMAKRGLPAWVCSPLMAKRMHSTNMFSNVEQIMRSTKLIEALHHTEVDWGVIHRWVAHVYLRGGHRRLALDQFARAAARGQLRSVVRDLNVILQRRRNPNTDGHNTGDSWRAAAAAWLREFDDCFQ
jgi:glycosyltransferase involved in cell wall biosynthesis